MCLQPRAGHRPYVQTRRGPPEKWVPRNLKVEVMISFVPLSHCQFLHCRLHHDTVLLYSNCLDNDAVFYWNATIQVWFHVFQGPCIRMRWYHISTWHSYMMTGIAECISCPDSHKHEQSVTGFKSQEEGGEFKETVGSQPSNRAVNVNRKSSLILSLPGWSWPPFTHSKQ